MKCHPTMSDGATWHYAHYRGIQKLCPMQISLPMPKDVCNETSGLGERLIGLVESKKQLAPIERQISD